jgi:hypothetical protein
MAEARKVTIVTLFRCKDIDTYTAVVDGHITEPADRLAMARKLGLKRDDESTDVLGFVCTTVVDAGSNLQLVDAYDDSVDGDDVAAAEDED